MKLAPRLICVAALLASAPAGADSTSGAPITVVKGPYLQALGPTSVEIRAEVDPPAAVSVVISGLADAGAPRVVRDDVVGAMHVVRVTGLSPAMRYAYALKAGTTVAKGELGTAPPPESHDPFTVLVYGDNRSDDTAHAAVVRAMLASPSDFVLNTGDLVQEGGNPANWQSFFTIEEPLIRNRAVFSCVGNHELTDGAGSLYLRYFGPTEDARGEGEKPRLYGSFRWADARFFLLDAMESFDSSPERAWLEDELTRADAEPGLLWRVVVLHHSPWSAGPHGGNSRALKAGIPALFAAHHVDLVVAGHDHIYERGFASGVRYLVSGGGGAPLYEIDHPLPSTRKAESVHHFVELTVASDALHLVAKRDDGTIIERCGMKEGTAGQGWDCDPAPVSSLPSSSAPSVASDVPPPPTATRCACNAIGVRTRGPSPLLFSGLAAFAATLLLVRRRPNRG